jgi:hypothetical protein
MGMGQYTSAHPSVEIERRRFFLIKKPLFDSGALEVLCERPPAGVAVVVAAIHQP